MSARQRAANLARALIQRAEGASQLRRASSHPPGSGYEAFANPVATHVPTPAEAAARSRRNALLAGVLFAASGAGYYTARQRLFSESNAQQPSEASSVSGTATAHPPRRDEHLINWSGTHEVTTAQFYQPETLEELEAIVAAAAATGQKLRCIGSGLSPNGIAFEPGGMVSLALMDKIVSIDDKIGRVTVQAGARVQDVADALRPHGLTLPNYASIREQTVAGLTQVSAHGTGAALPPMDDAVVGLKLVTPAEGTLMLSADQKGPDADLFKLARVGLGCLGVVAEVTMQCVPAHRLEEQQFASTAEEVKRHHKRWLKENKHLRYMWVPHTDTVVVVQCNEEGSAAAARAAAEAAARPGPRWAEAQRAAPMRDLAVSSGAVRGGATEAAGMSVPQLRDALLALDPINPNWVAKVNAAEAEVWRRSNGTRSGWSDEILGFECGGQQWVLEVAFPAGTAAAPSGADLSFVDDLQEMITRHNLPAPSPIEQRWTAGSASPMSPAAGAPGSIHSWVGVIMYLPEEEGKQHLRQEVTEAFKKYAALEEKVVMGRYRATEHWAKIEVPESAEDLRKKRERLAARFPVKEFAAARKRLDPGNVLGNAKVDTLLAPAES